MFYIADELAAMLKSHLSENRFLHSLGAAGCAMRLAGRFKQNESKAYLAGLLHDCAQYLRAQEMLALAEKASIDITSDELKDPPLLHAKLGAYIAQRDYAITDRDILQAIAFHSSGGIEMTPLDKIIGLSDAIEPSRRGPEIERLRELAETDLHEAYLEKHILYVTNTLKHRNFLPEIKLKVYHALLEEKMCKE